MGGPSGESGIVREPVGSGVIEVDWQIERTQTDGTIHGLAVPFATFVAIFQAVHGQLE